MQTFTKTGLEALLTPENCGSFKIGGTTRFHSDPSGKEVEV